MVAATWSSILPLPFPRSDRGGDAVGDGVACMMMDVRSKETTRSRLKLSRHGPVTHFRVADSAAGGSGSESEFSVDRRTQACMLLKLLLEST